MKYLSVNLWVCHEYFDPENYLSVNPWVCRRNFGLVPWTEIFTKISVTGSGERETELDALNKETPDWKE